MKKQHLLNYAIWKERLVLLFLFYYVNKVKTYPSDEQDNEDSSDVEQLFFTLLVAVFNCYHCNRKICGNKQQKKEKAYEKMDHYRAQHGLDMPNNAGLADVYDDDDYGKGTVVVM